MPIQCKNPVDCCVNLSHQLASNQSNWHFNARVTAHTMSDEFTFNFCEMALHAENNCCL